MVSVWLWQDAENLVGLDLGACAPTRHAAALEIVWLWRNQSTSIAIPLPLRRSQQLATPAERFIQELASAAICLK